MQIPFPNKKYNIIYADPPWHFQNYNGVLQTSNQDKTPYPYNVKRKKLLNLPVGDIADKDCILFMWVYRPKFIRGNRIRYLLKEWGFHI